MNQEICKKDDITMNVKHAVRLENHRKNDILESLNPGNDQKYDVQL